MVLFVSQSTSLVWLVFSAVWVLVLLSQSSRRRNPFGRRLDQLLRLLVPRTGKEERGPFAAFKEQARRNAASGVFRGSARRWPQLATVYAQGYKVASETISSPAQFVHSTELVGEVVAALKTEPAGGGAGVPTTDDPVVVLGTGSGPGLPKKTCRALRSCSGNSASRTKCCGAASKVSCARSRPQIRTASSATSREPHSSSAPPHESSRPQTHPAEARHRLDGSQHSGR